MSAPDAHPGCEFQRACGAGDSRLALSMLSAGRVVFNAVLAGIEAASSAGRLGVLDALAGLPGWWSEVVLEVVRVSLARAIAAGEEDAALFILAGVTSIDVGPEAELAGRALEAGMPAVAAQVMRRICVRGDAPALCSVLAAHAGALAAHLDDALGACADDGTVRALLRAGGCPRRALVRAGAWRALRAHEDVLLRCCALTGDAAAVRELLHGAGADPNAAGGEPLRHAIASGCAETVACLLQAGARGI
jgi:hypothetical protein